jgi:hypothetical protein
LDWLIELFFYRVIGGAIQGLFYWPGWLLLKMLTLGRYPPRQTVDHNRFAVALFAVVAMALMLAAVLTRAGP